MNEFQSASTRGGALNGKPPDGRLQAGSPGERILQQRYGTDGRASKFYCNQMTDRLTAEMIGFIGRMEMVFISTSDATGDCDCSFRAGQAGFVRVLDEQTIAYPELRGNGVMASLGNILENPRIGLLMIDFTYDLIGLHVNGAAEIVTPEYLQELDEFRPEQPANGGRRPAQWVLVRVAEAYIHCSKHIPKLIPQSRVRHWGTDNPRHKGGDFFGVAARNQAGLVMPAASAAGEHGRVGSADRQPADSKDQPDAVRREQADLPAGSPAGTFML
jgi:predicted pyridoxine 5'-phosphate oxidase superfamily flavin-nucleotide-binding protein